MKVVTAEEMRAIEAAAVRAGDSLDALMERAGTALADAAAGLAGDGNVLILTGPGNNGGDGLVAARLLTARGSSVQVYTFHREHTVPFAGEVLRAEEDPELAVLGQLLDSSAVVVDALLGIGQNRAPEGLLAEIIRAANQARGGDMVRIAVDICTGVNADTGAVPGEAFQADLTLCMGFLKRGTVLYPGAAFAGHAGVVDVGIPEELAADVRVEMPEPVDIAAMLPQRLSNSNKGTFGRVLVVGGSADFLGAPALVSIAALRSGAGLAEAAVTAEVQAAIAAHALEPIYARLPEQNGQIAPDAADTIARSLERADSLVFGPGMGLSDSTAELTRRVLDELRSTSRPAVIDADGLNALSRIPDWWKGAGRIVVTPHPGEMARLTGLSIKEIQADRVTVACRYAAEWGALVVLKGAGTIVAEPSGRASINPTGGPNLATGGTGDVLSGIIGGLLAQGCSLWEAGVAGVYLHGTAGDMLAEQRGDAGTLAGDLLPVVPEARRRVRQEGEESE